MRTTPFLWMTWLLFLFGWILLLSGIAALQNDCNKGHNALVSAAVAGFMGQVPCKKFYGYSWWIVWYAFLILLLVPILLARHSLHHFRAGALALIALLTMLLGDLTNTFLYYNNLNIPGAGGSRARVTVAGGIVTSIACYLMLILMGVVDEKKETKPSSGEPTGETMGGRFVPKSGTSMTYNPTYNEPVTRE